MKWFTDMVFGAKANDQGGLKKGEEYVRLTDKEVARVKAYQKVSQLSVDHGLSAYVWESGDCWEVRLDCGILDSKYPFTSKEKAPTGDPGMSAFVPGSGWARHVESVIIAGKKFAVVGDVTDPWPMSPIVEELDTQAEALEKALKRVDEIRDWTDISHIAEHACRYFTIQFKNGLAEGPFRYRLVDTQLEALAALREDTKGLAHYNIVDTYGKHFEVKLNDGSTYGRYPYKLKESELTYKEKAHAAAVHQVECELSPGSVRWISERSNYYAVILNSGAVAGTHYFTEEKVMKTVTKEEALEEAVKRVEFLAGGGMGRVVLSECDGYWGVTPEHGVREKHEWTPPKPVFKEGTVGFAESDNSSYKCCGFIVECAVGGYKIERLQKGFEGRQAWYDDFTPLSKELNVNDAETIKNLCIVRDCSFAFKL